MNHGMRMPALLEAMVLTLLLTACHGAPAGPTSYAATVRAYVPADGAFVALAPSALAPAASVSTDCNLDAVAGSALGSAPVARTASVLFAGWAAGGKGVDVPPKVEIVLQGVHAFGVRATTGQVRLDVAAATRNTQLMQSGFQVHAAMAAVPPGTYHVELRYQADGKAWICKPAGVLSVA